MLDEIYFIDLDTVTANAARRITENTNRRSGTNALAYIDTEAVRTRSGQGRSAPEIASELFLAELVRTVTEVSGGRARLSTLFLLRARSEASPVILDVIKRLSGIQLRSRIVSHKCIEVTFAIPDYDTFTAAHLLLRRGELSGLVRHHEAVRPYDSITITW